MIVLGRSCKLKEIKKYEDTIIAFLSDNGCTGYIGNACSNGQLAGFKRYHQEGGIRSSLYLELAGKDSGNRILEAPVISLDLMATFTAAAGMLLSLKIRSICCLTYLERKVPHITTYSGVLAQRLRCAMRDGS